MILSMPVRQAHWRKACGSGTATWELRCGLIEDFLVEKVPRFHGLGIWTGNFAGAGVIAEHLLQLHANGTGKSLLRLCPVLPQTMDASFAGLLTEGAFEASATRRQRRVQDVRITSRRGARCRAANP